MPGFEAFLPLAEAGVQGGGSLLSGHFNRRWQSRMYGRQYDDSIKFWNMQNAYNSPSEQMQRFRDAGLNPNLIYGQGNPGNAGSIPTPEVGSAPYPDIGGSFRGLSAGYMAMKLGNADLRIKQAQANNLNEQTAVIREDAALRRLQAERTGFDLDLSKDLRETSADAARVGLEKLRTEVDTMIDRNAREAALNASNLNEAAQRMMTMIEARKSLPLERGRISADTRHTVADIARIRESVSLMAKDGVLRDFDIKLRQAGVTPGSTTWERLTGMFLSDISSGKVTNWNLGSSVWNWIIGK